MYKTIAIAILIEVRGVYEERRWFFIYLPLNSEKYRDFVLPSILKNIKFLFFFEKSETQM